MINSLPKISYCVFTYNEEKNIADCLSSIFEQNYPKDKLEVILVDDASEDRTLEIAKKFPVKIFINGKRDGDLSATIGFHHASGEFFTAIGADMRFRSKNWFRQMVRPFMENPDIPAVITKFYSHPRESMVTKYLSLDPLQRDLVYQLFSINIEETIVEKKEGYYICHYTEAKIPPQSHGLYRISVMRKIIAEQGIWYDMGNLVALVKSGYLRFGYVPSAGYYHFHAESLMHLLKKRVRNIKRSYLRYSSMASTKHNQYKWVDLTKYQDFLKLFLLLIFANLFFPIFLFSIFRMIKYRKWLYFLEAPITLLLVDTIAYTFLTDPRGRRFVKKGLTRLFYRH